MNLDHDFVQVWKFSEDQKKNKQMEHFFPQIQVKTKKKVFRKNIVFPQIYTLRCTPIQIIGGMQMQTILELLGGIQPNIGREYIPPLVSAPLFGQISWVQKLSYFFLKTTHFQPYFVKMILVKIISPIISLKNSCGVEQLIEKKLKRVGGKN